MSRSQFAALAVSLALGAGLLPPATASAWAPPGEATVHPGVQVFTEGAQCTANFVFEGGGEVYLGQAAHCSGTGGATETDGCESGSLSIGTPVEVTGASRPGTLAYNSWLTMQASGERDADGPKQGVLVRNEGNGWSHDVLTATPGIPGDSGSGFLNASGGAIGVLNRRPGLG